jgi:hypothetical protein
MSEQETLYVCESCGHSTPLEAEACPECGGKMAVYSDEIEPNYEDLEDEELDSNVGLKDDSGFGTESLEDLAHQEREESDEEYRNDAFEQDE